MNKDLISIHDLSASEVGELIRLAAEIKGEPSRFATALQGRSLAMIFQKSSTRTRVSFEVGMFQLGGQAVFLSGRDLQLGRGENLSDTAKVLSGYVEGIMARVFAHSDIEELGREATVPVINGLTDDLHPCQALADMFTLHEIFGDMTGRKLAYIGDGNNMAHSLMLAAPKVGADFAIAAPEGFDAATRYVDRARAAADAVGTRFQQTRDPLEAASGASAVYTDVWASMGQEDEAESRLKAFEGYTVDGSVMSAALPEAVFLHCLPCHRGEEVSAEVVDGPRSRIFPQAANRNPMQKAILVTLMG